MDYIRNNMAARAADLRLYLDYNPDHAKFNAVSYMMPLVASTADALQLHADANNQPYMIFLKWFDCSRQTLQGQGKVFVNRNSKVSDLLPYIQEKMKWPSSTPIKLYEVSGEDAPFTFNSPTLLLLPVQLPTLHLLPYVACWTRYGVD